MSSNSKRILAILGTLVLGGALGFYVYTDFSSIEEITSNINRESNSSTLTAVVADDVSDDDVSDDDVLLPEPPKNWDKSYTASSDLSKLARAESERKVADIIAELRENSAARSKWLALGIYRKNSGDYAAAEDVWQYVTEVWPNDAVAYGNLADLYTSYTKEYAKAEVKLLKVIELNTAYIPAYRNLHSIYLYNYKTDTNNAEEILMTGLANNPNNLDLLGSIALYYKEVGETEKALRYLKRSMVEAKRLGVTEYYDPIQFEIDSLQSII